MNGVSKMRFVVMATVLVNSFAQLLAQPSSAPHLNDSIDYKTIFAATLDSVTWESKNNTNYIQVFEDPRLLQLSAGMNFLNVVRWQIPGLIPSPSFITGNPISPNYLFAIDGVPYNSDLSYFANLNTFDFDRIVVLSAVNGAVDYGLFGGNGGMLLRRKSGNGVVGPHFEFNSFLTPGLTPSGTLTSSSEDKIHLSNSLSFAQDFGTIDTRVSYNYTLIPAKEVEPRVQMNSIKINTGIQILPNLRSTIIFEKFSRKDTQLELLRRLRPNGGSNFQTLGLELEYQPIKWLSFLARAFSNELDYNNRFDIINTVFFFNGVSRNAQNRKFVQSSIRSSHTIGKHFEVHPILTFQKDNTGFDREYFGLSQGEDTNQSISGGVNATYKQSISLDLCYRLDENNFSQSKKASVYTGAVSWNFSKSFRLSRFIDFGRLRSNFGHRDGNVAHPLTQVFPQISIDQPQQFYSSQTGIDLSLLSNKIQISYNHYLIFDEGFRQVTVAENPYLITYIDYTKDPTISGNELVIGSYPLGTKDWYAKLTWTRPNSSELSFVPDWFGNIYVMREWKELQLSASISYQKGGESFVDMKSYTASNIGLRDVSISHKVSYENSGRFGLREIIISLTGRNLLLVRASGLPNPELSSVYNGMYTSFTLNVSGKLN